ncbi:hypothetical protein I79_000311 [Cricetulus griseus]|uniref:Uncharacterized protein n=1 Tax=Cricetulus griseus TaxID=10029 RepID=G3GS05_CRIGR|nr:hypothetical protein I79_000311 [Cricetulus griseus]
MNLVPVKLGLKLPWDLCPWGGVSRGIWDGGIRQVGPYNLILGGGGHGLGLSSKLPVTNPGGVKGL